MNDEQYFLDIYKESAIKIRGEVKEYAKKTLKTFDEDDPMRKETIRFVVDGGKRFRPSLAYIISKFYGLDLIQPVLALEYLHKYFLTHDDIIDKDEVRYHQPTVHSKLTELFDYPNTNREVDEVRHFGNSLAIVSGDMMCADAYNIILNCDIADSKKIALSKLVSLTIEQTVYGWYIQFLMDYMRLDDSRLSYDRILESLIWVTGKYTMQFPILFGLTLAGVGIPSEVDKLADNLGILFQTGDDIIGIFGDPQETGKSNFGDLIQGKKTLPIWYSYENANVADKKQLINLVGKKDLNGAEAEEIRNIVKQSGGYEMSLSRMKTACDESIEIINHVDFPSDLKRFLSGFAVYLVKRSS